MLEASCKCDERCVAANVLQQRRLAASTTSLSTPPSGSDCTHQHVRLTLVLLIQCMIYSPPVLWSTCYIGISEMWSSRASWARSCSRAIIRRNAQTGTVKLAIFWSLWHRNLPLFLVAFAITQGERGRDSLTRPAGSTGSLNKILDQQPELC